MLHHFKLCMLCLHLPTGQHSKSLHNNTGCKFHYSRNLMISAIRHGKKYKYILISIIGQMSCTISTYWISAKNQFIRDSHSMNGLKGNIVIMSKRKKRWPLLGDRMQTVGSNVKVPVITLCRPFCFYKITRRPCRAYFKCLKSWPDRLELSLKSAFKSNCVQFNCTCVWCDFQHSSSQYFAMCWGPELQLCDVHTAIQSLSYRAHRPAGTS